MSRSHCVKALFFLTFLLCSSAALHAANVTLAWDADTDSQLAGYKLYYGTSSGVYGTSINVGNAITYTIQSLPPGTYYFAVTAYDAQGNESGYSNEVSTTIAGPPSAPANLSPANGATGISVTPTLSWSASSGATSYDVYFGTTVAPPLAGSVAGTTYAPGTLIAGTTYYWKVVAQNDSGSASSAIVSFTTAVAGSPPGMPSNLSPANGATGISTSPTLSWSASSGAASYDVYFGTGSTPALAANVSGTTYVPATLAAGTCYYWKVTAKNTFGSSSSAIFSFTTATASNPPEQPSNLSPANGATGISTTPTLSWSASSGASSYDVYLGTSSSPSLVGNVATNSYAPSALTPNTTYYWKITAKNAVGSASSAILSFTTAAVALAAPANLVPVNGATGVSLTPTLSWSAVANATSYDVYFGSSTPSLAANVTGTTYAPGTLAGGTCYYWKVVAKNASTSSSSAIQSFTTGGSPAQPSNLSPANGATSVSTNPTLSWSASSGATSYDVYFGTSSSPSLVTTISNTSYATSGLTANTTYYWKITAKNGFGSTSSAVLSFTTAVASAAPANLVPVNGATGVSLTPTLSWSPVINATSYDVYFGTSSTPPLAANVTGTSYAPATLAGVTRYYWKIIARTTSGLSSSAIQSFTTGNPPAQPSNLSPTNGATGLSSNPTLSWSASSGATSYDIYFGTSSSLSLVTTITNTSYAMSGLTGNTTYSWKITAKNGSGSTSSATLSFTTGAPPSAPTNLAPANGLAGTSLSLVLSWSASSSASSYDIYLGTSSTPPLVASITGTAYASAALSASTTYYWKVASKNSFGTSPSATLSFTTMGQAIAPPTNLNPANGATGVSLNPTLSWSASASATSYDVYLGTGSVPSLVANVTATTYTPTGLKTATTYVWQVTAKNSFGSGSSAIQIFTTIGSAPPAPTDLKPQNGATVSGYPVLSWSPSTGADSYDVYFGTSNPPPFAASTDATHYIPGLLRINTTFYWSVTAKNSMGSSATATMTYTIGTTIKAALPRLATNYTQTMNGEVGAPADQYTGIAIANLGTSEAVLDLTAYSPDGSPIAGPGINNPVSINLEPGQQIPVIDARLFGDAPGSKDMEGWVQVESSSDAIACYFILFDTTLSLLDGVPVPATGLRTFVLPEIENQGSTQIRIANPNDSPATLTFNVIGSDGTTVGSQARSLDADGSLVESFTTLFPGLPPTDSQYLLVASDKDVVPLELFGNTNGDISAINGLDTAGGAQTLYGPQYAAGGAWKSSISVINLESVSGTVTLRLRGNDGAQIGQTRTESINANGKIYINDQAYFTDGDGQSVSGYLEIISSGPRLSGSVTFGDPRGISYAATLPLVSTLENSVVFPHVASDDIYFTGIALLNPGPEPAQLTLEVFAEDGTMVGTAQETVPAGGRACKLLTEYLPSFTGKSQTSGYIRVHSDKAIAAFALFGTQSLSSLAALPAQPAP